MLILHQFETRMLPDKSESLDYEHVEIVIDADGYGPPLAKWMTTRSTPASRVLTMADSSFFTSGTCP